MVLGQLPVRTLAAAKHAYAVVGLVSRKWISTHLTANPDSVAARVLFSRGLDGEGLLTDEFRARLAEPHTGASNEPSDYPHQPQPASDHPMLPESQPDPSRRVRYASPVYR